VCQAGGVEVAAPRFVGPAGDADAYLSRHDGCPPTGLDDENRSCFAAPGIL
jgi:hypothetical protein